MVYFVKNPKNGLIKIGWSRFVPARIRTLRREYGDDLRLLKCIEGDHKIERRLHKRFRKSCVRSEWFRESKRLRQFIKSSKIAFENYVACYVPMPAEVADFLRDLAAREYRTTSAQVQVILEQWLASFPCKGKEGVESNATNA